MIQVEDALRIQGLGIGVDADDECGCMSDGVVSNTDEKLTLSKRAVLKL